MTRICPLLHASVAPRLGPNLEAVSAFSATTLQGMVVPPLAFASFSPAAAELWLSKQLAAACPEPARSSRSAGDRRSRNG